MNDNLTLTRTTTGKFGTFGVLSWGSSPLCCTLERPWLDNQIKMSCIPPGSYKVTKYTSPKHGRCYWLHDVPGRSSILIHSGNDLSHTQGCILVGQSFCPAGIIRSRQALESLLELTPNTFTLTVKDIS